MSASSNSVNDQSKKRVRKEEKDKGSKKRRRIESTVLSKEEISIQTYFPMLDVTQLDSEQIEIWEKLIEVLKKYIFPNDIVIDIIDSLSVLVSAKVFSILKEMRYAEIDVAKLETQLEKRQNQFIETLYQLRHSSVEDLQGREYLFKKLYKLLKKGVPNLTVTDSAGWNIAHIAIYFGRLDLLIFIQQYLLPDQLEQYETLFQAKTNKSKAKPVDMKKTPYYGKSSSLLNETELPLLKRKHLTIILEMLVAGEGKAQHDILYEQAKQLIIEGVDPTVTESTRGWTILHYAVYKRDLDLVEDILRHASLEHCKILLCARTKETESTAFSIANSYNYKEVSSLLDNKQNEIFKEELALIFKDLRRFTKVENKKTLYEKIENFIKNGGDPMVTSDNGWNFLHYAVNFNDATLAHCVIKNITPEQYELLLRAKTKELKVTPYEMAVNRNEKGFNNEALLQLLKPQIDTNISQPLEQLSGQFAFFKSVMSLDELCQRLNDCVAALGEFQIQRTSAEEEPNLGMPYFTDDEEEIDEFIHVLEECSIMVSKNSDNPEHSFIIVQGVEDRDKFLNNKNKLAHFAKEHQSTFVIPSITI